VSLSVAPNLYVAEKMPDKLATLLLRLQSDERLTIGRTRGENLELIVEPDDGRPIYLLPRARMCYPRTIRPYKRPRRANVCVHIFLGENPWPLGNHDEYLNPDYEYEPYQSRAAKGDTNAPN
jgi:hypothetical protein